MESQSPIFQCSEISALSADGQLSNETIDLKLYEVPPEGVETPPLSFSSPPPFPLGRIKVGTQKDGEGSKDTADYLSGAALARRYSIFYDMNLSDYSFGMVIPRATVNSKGAERSSVAQVVCGRCLSSTRTHRPMEWKRDRSFRAFASTLGSGGTRQ
ncbi:hypothetical protein EVAR_82216_1 [Eumeta japonica]|uniref:Uncharacterized protein n=1 Tax=Eumeta variegata TaxID=151549 RepID=A0A4C1W7X0_EUMVA|nr:hypothetical protein EVAR_82216_1 [Eumeta japonica]